MTTPAAGAVTSRITGATGKSGQIRIAPLRSDPTLVRLSCGATRHRVASTLSGVVELHSQVRQHEQPRARFQYQLREVGRPLTGDRLGRLADLERVSDGSSERLVHVREQADDLTPGAAAEVDHLLREDARVVERLHERAVADLDVEDDGVRSGRDLLGHDRRGDERDDVHRPGDVAERVELPVGGDEVTRLPDDGEADFANLVHELVDRELDAEARYRLELVERAPGVSEAAPAHLSEGHAAGSDDRADGERRLVPHSAGRVLVDDATAERLAEVQRLARTDHRVGQRVRLAPGQPLEVHGHAPGGHLVVGNVAARVSDNELRQLLVGELLPVPLALDQLGAAGSPASALPATKIVGCRRTTKGGSNSGRRPPRPPMSVIDDRM